MAARWNPTDDVTLHELYADGVSLREIGDRLGRSARSVDERRRTLAISPRRQVPAWTAAEDRLVCAAAATDIPDRQLAQRLARPIEQVRCRRHLIVGARPAARPYSAAEDEQVRACWADGGDIDALAHRLDRSEGSVRLRAQALDLYRPRPRRRWRADEDAILRDGYEQALSCTQIVSQLAGRSAGAVAARAAKLGIVTYARVWSPLDDHRLRVLSAEGCAVELIAQALGRTPQALLLRTRRLGIALAPATIMPRAGRRWTTSEDEVLRINRALNPAVLAGALGRSSSAVVQRMRRLGLHAERSPHHPAVRRGALTPGERATAVRELRVGGPGRVFALARRLEVPPEVIRAAASAEAAAYGSTREPAGRS